MLKNVCGVMDNYLDQEFEYTCIIITVYLLYGKHSFSLTLQRMLWDAVLITFLSFYFGKIVSYLISLYLLSVNIDYILCKSIQFELHFHMHNYKHYNLGIVLEQKIMNSQRPNLCFMVLLFISFHDNQQYFLFDIHISGGFLYGQ